MDNQILDFVMFVLVIFFLLPSAAIFAILKGGRSLLGKDKPDQLNKHV